MSKDKLEVLAIIPARGGSKGVPKKNIKPIMDKPLIAYTIDAARNSNYISRVIVSTDSEEIALISREYGAEVPFLRPAELASDKSPTNDAITHLIKELKVKDGYEPDIICLLQCTSPLRGSEAIDGTIKRMIDTKSDGAVSVCEVECNPYWTNVFKNEKLEYFIEEGRKITRRQDLPEVYRINGAVYAVKTNVFLEQNTLEPENMTGYVMSSEDSIDIDTMIDFRMAEIILQEKTKDIK